MGLLATAAGSLPFISLFLFILGFTNKSSPCLFPAVCKGSVFWGLLLTIASYGFSALGLLSALPITVFWLTTSSFALTFVILHRRNLHISIPCSLFYFFIYAICALTLLAALAYPPTYPDSLAYHLPRVMYWLQNGSLAPYYTTIDRQIGMAPFNSLVALQSIAIAHSDYLVNLPQWLAFCGCIAGAAFLASQLKQPLALQKLAALYFCTTPIAIMQSGNSENSLIVTFWLCVFVAFFLEWWERPAWQSSLIVGTALGLAILTKGLAYPVALPFVICTAWKCLRKLGKVFLMGIAMALIIIAINLPHIYNNYTASHSITLSAEKNIISKPEIRLTAVNAVFHFLLEEPWLVAIASKKKWSDLAAHAGVDDHDENLFPWGGIERGRSNLVPSDNDGQSPIHALILLFTIPWLLWKRPAALNLYTYLFCGAFVFFCAVLVWQPWAARLHLPFFLLASPLVAYALAAIALPWLKKTILGLLVAFCLFPLFFCLEHPLGPPSMLAGYRENIGHFISSSREENYFNLWRTVRRQYIAAANFLAAQQPSSIGIDVGDNGFEYPLWAILSSKMKYLPRFRHTPLPCSVTASSPDYIFSLPYSAFSELGQPRVFKKTESGYLQVFPAQREESSLPDSGGTGEKPD